MPNAYKKVIAAEEKRKKMLDTENAHGCGVQKLYRSSVKTPKHLSLKLKLQEKESITTP